MDLRSCGSTRRLLVLRVHALQLCRLWAARHVLEVCKVRTHGWFLGVVGLHRAQRVVVIETGLAGSLCRGRAPGFCPSSAKSLNRTLTLGPHCRKLGSELRCKLSGKLGGKIIEFLIECGLGSDMSCKSIKFLVDVRIHGHLAAKIVELLVDHGTSAVLRGIVKLALLVEIAKLTLDGVDLTADCGHLLLNRVHTLQNKRNLFAKIRDLS
mmetsp:Transcript_91827/g.230721  ORF Transcript_91827/g.230721 Transcript_91827/m.230721 type:complete len:210 (+) Transcript_91827:463-1092(+)